MDQPASASEWLHALGLTLPDAGGDSNYVNHRVVDSAIHISGRLPYQDGVLLGRGIVGRDVGVPAAREVADAASELLVQVPGENGRHARTAIGVAGLPRNSPVEVQLVCTASTRSAT